MAETRPQCLVVGAGAVGAVYGRHLSLGGADVTFFVREKYAAGLESGMTLFSHNDSKAGPIRFTDYRLISKVDEVGNQRWQQVYLTLSSTALRSADAEKILRKVNKDAILILLQPGLEDFQVAGKIFPPERIVRGMISLLSYQAPLQNQNLESCIAYWFPPLVTNPFAGDTALLDSILPIFEKGKMPVSYARDLDQSVSYGTAYFMPLLAALEKNHWSFAALRQSGDLAIVGHAADEAGAVIVRTTGLQKPVGLALVGSPLMHLVLGFQKFFVPFDLEAYFKYHFTKVKDQTALYLDNYIALGRQYGIGIVHLETLRAFVKV